MGCGPSANAPPVAVEVDRGGIADNFSTLKREKIDAFKHYFRGNALMEEGKPLEALEEYTLSIRDRPEFSSAFYERGLAYKKLQRWNEALHDFTTAVHTKADYGVAFCSRASVYIELENYDQAIFDCTKALDINPDDASAYHVRANAFAKKGDSERAFDDFERWGQLETKRLCIVCMEASRGSRLHPCLHAALCGPCAKNLQKKQFGCPLCLMAIENIEFGEFNSTFAFDDEFGTSEFVLTGEKSQVMPFDASPNRTAIHADGTVIGFRVTSVPAPIIQVANPVSNQV